LPVRSSDTLKTAASYVNDVFYIQILQMLLYLMMVDMGKVIYPLGSNNLSAVVQTMNFFSDVDAEPLSF
jgi:hypothetical protein